MRCLDTLSYKDTCEGASIQSHLKRHGWLAQPAHHFVPGLLRLLGWCCHSRAGYTRLRYKENSSVHYDGKEYILCARKVVLLDILSPAVFTIFTSLVPVVSSSVLIRSSIAAKTLSVQFGAVARTTACRVNTLIEHQLTI